MLDVLGKRRGDLTADDAELMETLLDRVTSKRRDDLEPIADDATWRHRLCTSGTTR